MRKRLTIALAKSLYRCSCCHALASPRNGVCFKYRSAAPPFEDEDTYLAAELLPERSEVEIELCALWPKTANDDPLIFKYDFLHDGLVRAIIAEIGELAGVYAVYWRNGVCLYDSENDSHGRIDQVTNGDWRGEIRVAAHGGRAAELWRVLRGIVEREQQRLGLKGEVSGEQGAMPVTDESATKLLPGPDPRARPAYYVSYAWKDKSNWRREKDVDRLCKAAEDKGSPIYRDKADTTIGDSFSEFMERIACGIRVFVFLSERYLHSDFCMRELTALWIDCRQKPEELRRRSRLFALPDAKFWKIDDRIPITDYWKDRAATLRSRAIGASGTHMSTRDFDRLRQIE